jgi:hypothetical protein
MISPLVSKVNPSYLAEFAHLRECSVVVADLLLRTVPPAGTLEVPMAMTLSELVALARVGC